ncbi:hypothetical protein QO003_000475 [Arthrobacter silviterrae]|uniref:DUF6318 domain-containing protein n=1 Tax=Arthrobacter silviterrae TaxID=2026658 RepID=A0ABX0DEM7_9MICC|nr:DUF6318 family protein [Arthrobacter silviterrae]MDQ0276172.1 hypothetical protein [Arthrobacter silviterrae]NGN82637.1 hypothetical protein [Arthrobacter silviterrae]
MTTDLLTIGRTIHIWAGRAGRGQAEANPPRSRVLHSRFLATVLGAVLLAGCSSAAPPVAGSGSPGHPPTTAAATAAATAAPTNPPTPAYKPATAAGPAQNVPVPVLPAKAKEFSKEGLEAFAAYWYSTLGYAYETGNVAPMVAVTDPSCKSCAGAQESISARYGDGGWLVGGQMVVHSSTSTFHVTPESTYQAILLIHQQRVISYNADKTVDVDIPAMTPRADIVVASYHDGHWTAQKAEHLTKD